MVQIQLLSDLHLEAPKSYDLFPIPAKAPYLALLGDIGNVAPHKDDLLSFLTAQLSAFRIVFFVPGNHEAYHSSWPETLSILNTFQSHIGNTRQQTNNASLGEFVLLGRNVHHLEDGVVVLGCSLFSHVPKEAEMAVSMGLNDFLQISSGGHSTSSIINKGKGNNGGKDWDVEMHNEWHRRDLAWLNEQVGKMEDDEGVKSIVVLTHWSPTRDHRAADPRHVNSPITAGFSTDLSQEVCFRGKKVKVWAFGHTHFNCDFAVNREWEGAGGGLRLVTNQRGYYFAQSAGFDAEKVIEI
ncbi:Metallo-dependent phosphatase-like protein [Diplogelasinospora grovesii]|uniref:Metallo-dependent phosphatase-like protein n=1 Tax=Diplogelasinospora grovesii TaxID=303347 RepID=A0AAN6N8E6_9PEZI|nr:Metallo-dependent phosphatase-like protein [Diplogelasinospora grovesii]